MAPTEAIEFAGSERFQLLRRLGAGGVGVVYETFDRERNGLCALKTLHTFSSDAILRFKEEFRALQDLEHPNLVSLGELIEDAGCFFFTMELVRGVHFLRWVRRGSSDSPLPHTLSDAGDDLATGRIFVPPLEQALAAGTLDEVRLRHALAQLARGLGTLHAAHKVHRDIKSSNLLVTDVGRVVVLDFGLVAQSAVPTGDSGLVGTVSHMAPEQVTTGGPVGPAADWYSVGVVLYQALTGRAPFVGTPPEVLARKQSGEPPAPRTLVPGLPADLDQLCVELLRRDPVLRPGAAEVLRRLEGDAAAAVEIGERPQLFVGRRAELEMLREAFAQVGPGPALAVFVLGESGVGKSALIREFAEAQAARSPGLVVLSGRCYERESVPYKAVDGVVDSLARWLAGAPDEALLAHPSLPLLAHVFPVLRELPGAPEDSTAQAAAEAQALDPAQQRARVFAAVRELLRVVATHHPLLVMIDDLQWADEDSLALLAEVMRGPDAPPLCLVTAVRRTHEQATGLPPPWYRITGHVVHLVLEPLPFEEARELAALLGAPEPDVVASEAGGHPLFIDELVRYTRDPGRQQTLEETFWARILRHGDSARDLLELVAVAGAPLQRELAAEAASLSADEYARVEAVLRGAHLVRTSGPRATDLVEHYHDRVREIVLAKLAEPRRRELHRRLAQALEVTSRAVDQLAVHWREAGDHEKAAFYTAEAAAQAAEALAFERAAGLYRLAIELRPDVDGPGGRALRIALGEALANAGRGAEAARAFHDAAATTRGAEALEIERRAAEQLLRAGHIDEGVECMRQVLASVGIPMAKTPRRALASLLWHRAQLRLRGLGFRARSAEKVPAGELARFDVCFSAAIGMAMVDTVRGADFQTRSLLLALRCGEPRRVARAVALEAANSSAGGHPSRRRTAQLTKLTQELALYVGHPHATGLALGTAGIAAYLEGRFVDARKLCERAEVTFRERCIGAAWELDNVILFALWSLTYLGELRELQVRLPRMLRDAEARGDRFAATSMRTGNLSYAWLAADDPAGALREADEAMRKWTRSGFLHQHWDDLLARGEIDLYQGDGAAALARVRERWKPLNDSYLLLIQISRIEAHNLRARAALAAAKVARSEEDKRALLRAAEADARRIERERTPWATPLARLLAAGIAAARGDRARALSLLEAAAPAFASAEMALHAAAARRRRGLLVGGDEGALLVATAERWMRDQHIADPAKMTDVLAP